MDETTHISWADATAWFERILERLDREIDSERFSSRHSPYGAQVHLVRASTISDVRDILDSEFWPSPSTLDGRQHLDMPEPPPCGFFTERKEK